MNEWHTIRLGDVSITNRCLYSKNDNWEFVNYLDTGNITQNRINSIQTIDLSKEKLPSRAKRKVQHNDILFSTVRPNQLHYGIVKEQPVNFLVSTGFAVISIMPEKVDADYLYFYLTQNSVVESLHAIAEQSTSAYPSIKPSDIEKLELQLPSLETQQKIAAVLMSMEQKIVLNNNINENLEQQMRAIYLDKCQNSNWSLGTLDDILEFYDYLRKPLSSKQREHMDKIYPYYGATSIVDYIDNYIFDGVFILISEDGANVVDEQGYPLVQYTYGKFWLNNHAHIVKGKEDISEALVYTLVRTTNLRSIVTGAAQPKINQANLRQFKINLPDKSSIQKLNTILEPMLAMIIANDIENSKLASMRDSLLPKLMSGEIDVSSVTL